MKIVIDSNRVIAALIKDSTTREIIFDNFFTFVAPDFIFVEIEKYREEIMRKSGITDEEFTVLLDILFKHILIIPKKDYESFIGNSTCAIRDVKDVPYLALAKSSNAEGIWTHDSDFLEQDEIKVFTNSDLLALAKNRE